MIFETDRLIVRKATLDDVEHYLQLWNNSNVMKMVGFPQGLNITRQKVSDLIKGYDDTEFDQTLVVIEKSSDRKIGECKLGFPDEDRIASTDIKLFPEFWGKGYGKEIKNALCKYLFQHTAAEVVKADPNIKNIASQRMQEACGGKQVGESTYHFPAQMQHYTEDVHSLLYHIYKADWLNANLSIKAVTDPEEKSNICSSILLELPQWFGIPEANEAYIKGVKSTEFIVAYMFGKAVGFYSIIRHFPETAEIYVCGILADFHRLGIGRSLQTHIENLLQKDDVKYLTVKTLSVSHPDKNYANTRKFYRSVGFLPVEEFKTLWGEANPCLLMLKVL